MDKLFYLFQLSLGMHIAASFLLLLLTRGSQVAEELFEQPNKFLGTVSWMPRLLSAIYFIPWRKAPDSVNLQHFSVISLFWLCRLAGTCTVISILGFFVSAFVVAGGHA